MFPGKGVVEIHPLSHNIMNNKCNFKSIKMLPNTLNKNIQRIYSAEDLQIS